MRKYGLSFDLPIFQLHREILAPLRHSVKMDVGVSKTGKGAYNKAGKA
jgi:hypothetical protein